MSTDLITYMLFRRDDDNTAVCPDSNDFNGRTNLRILSIFMILISSGIGAFFPILSSRYSFIRLPNWCFFIAKFFGSGVIVATAFVHLLEPASDALTDDCLTGAISEYPWAFGICLMSLFLLFLVEIISHHLMANSLDLNHNQDIGSIKSDASTIDDIERGKSDTKQDDEVNKAILINETGNKSLIQNINKMNSIPGENHYSHTADHQEINQIGTPLEEEDKENYASQILAISFLEFGIIFHSVFVGLSLAVSGDEFITLFIVLIFHQMFEGLGLGTRIAEANWPKSKRFTPWLLALAFTITTPVAIAIGLGVRHSFVPGSRRALIANGCFDAISAGILIYTGLVELMAHEFLFSKQFKGPDGLKKMLFAYLVMCCGAGIMALLGKWA